MGARTAPPPASLNTQSPSRMALPVRQVNGVASSGFFGTSSDATPAKERQLKSSQKTSTNTSRSQSVDHTAFQSDDVEALPSKQKRDKDRERDRDRDRDRDRSRDHHTPAQTSQDIRKGSNPGFFGGLGSSLSKAADGSGKASRGLFSKLTRSGSSNDKAGYTRPADDDRDYELKVLNLPLVEQTRETRIAKSYDQCRDKTEFWMPALPWRCIDYLNGKCEEEGLYRVSGGETDIRRWRRRFDSERDINLLDEPELYDASAIASLFKWWLRELPEEIFPKALQHKSSKNLSNEPGAPVPQEFRDELSNLPPFNYYLLFAITCHLSLLQSCKDRNRMTVDNLYTCFNVSLKLEKLVFNNLVGNWRQCWQGRCYPETDYLRAEYEYLKTPFPAYMAEGAITEEQRTGTPNSNGARSDKSKDYGTTAADDVRPATSHTQPLHNTVEEGDNDLLSPGRKQQRSSSDATGASPMKLRNSINPH